ncbi:hypothetical protein [Magnetospira sp. QH-2]|uniref:hypothetical protein n=1 Tax=Magnetospira sp. (strain QH-2) TaxID=1288970 RepID=UPI0003E80F34|nr:hypothetical protein [Magnetospira sp. QH-2]CCQ75519.1 conserved protein of unknown function [Magnetospira sp. QH-2]
MTQENGKLVAICHTVDTEGPLWETQDATFERLEEMFGVRGLPRTSETMEKLRQREIPLNGLEDLVAGALNQQRTTTLKNWGEVDAMLDQCMDQAFRHQLKDSYGGGWVYNWHCLDHVGFQYNPRHRDMGHHSIFDRYMELVNTQPDCPDAIHFHFHPVSTFGDAHRCATSYLTNSTIWDVLCRKVIERKWFPVVFRAGFQTERPDSHWLLEQYVPFDVSNMATEDSTELDAMIDFRKGRSGNWRTAPADWSVYHPHHDDYRRPGNCRRWIARSLNVLSRVASIDQYEMDKAFARANQGNPTLVGLCSHDFRDLTKEVNETRNLIAKASEKYPDVRFKYCEGVDAFRRVLGMTEANDHPLDLEVTLDRNPKNDVPNITISTRAGQVFGPQPFLAIETHGRRFIHDNLDFNNAGNEWYYAFHHDTLMIEDVKKVGIAANDKYGNQFVEVLDLSK